MEFIWDSLYCESSTVKVYVPDGNMNIKEGKRVETPLLFSFPLHFFTLSLWKLISSYDD